MYVNENILQRVQKSYLYNRLDAEDLEKVVADVNIRNLKQGEYYCQQGRDVPGVYMVVEGKISFTIADEGGHELVLAYAQQNVWSGYPEVMSKTQAAANAKVLEDTCIYFIPANIFIKQTRLYPQLAYALIEQLSLFHVLQSKVIGHTSHRGMDYRIAKHLAMMCYMGDYAVTKETEWEVPITQEELANSVAGSRQSINKILKKWQADEKIELKFGAIKIKDMHWLLKLV